MAVIVDGVVASDFHVMFTIATISLTLSLIEIKGLMHSVCPDILIGFHKSVDWVQCIPRRVVMTLWKHL